MAVFSCEIKEGFTVIQVNLTRDLPGGLGTDTPKVADIRLLGNKMLWGDYDAAGCLIGFTLNFPSHAHADQSVVDEVVKQMKREEVVQLRREYDAFKLALGRLMERLPET